MKKLISIVLLNLCALLFSVSPAKAQVAYTLKPTPKTVAWGNYDAKSAPVLRVGRVNGDIHTLITSTPRGWRMRRSAGTSSNPCATYDQVTDKGPGGHILTGPVYIEVRARRCAGNPHRQNRARDSLRL